jgi:hypothetical protein
LARSLNRHPQTLPSQYTQQSQIQATGLAPPDDRESAIYAILAAGNYTAIVAGVNKTTGIAPVEVYLR